MGHTPYVAGARRLAETPAPGHPGAEFDPTYQPYGKPVAVTVTAEALPLGSTRVALAMLRDILLIIVLAGVIYFGASALYALGKVRDSLNVPAATATAADYETCMEDPSQVYCPR
jgi:hypothetical protein